MRRRMGLARWFGSQLLLAIVLIVPLACSDDSAGGKADPNQRLIGVYSATIEAIAKEAGLPSSDDDSSAAATIFISEREDASINADVQVGVVLALEDWATVRFIDELDEAVDLNEPTQPVRSDGILVGLGPVSDGDASATVYADRYVAPDMTIVYDVSLIRRMGEWQLAEPLSGTEVNVAP